VLAAREDRLDRIELQSTAFNLIVAGHETTTNLIGATVRALFAHPDLRERLVDPETVGEVLEELIRHDGPVHHATFRYAAEPVELGGTTIPAGGQVLICLAAANRDERAFTDPGAIDLDRAGPRHLGFGHGIHHCLGAGLARLEGAIAITSLLRRFPDLRPAVPLDSLTWDRGDGIVLRGLTSLPVVLGPAAS
jgi:cytochrome P450